MSVNLSIKNAPDDLVQQLKARAERHHRSLQGEMMAILEAAVRTTEPLTPTQVLAQVRQLGLTSPAEAVAMQREDRNDR